MTLTKICLLISLFATLATLGNFYAKKYKNIAYTFLQHFCGIWFVFSGFVKVVDPLGLAFKMDQYFEQFQFTFAGIGWEAVANMFISMKHYSPILAIIIIVAEIMIGIMLILGIKPKLTVWLFFILMVFFTILTGYTHLTGYVPDEVNFFSFGKWGEFDSKNMKVTDCGCFGDFLKLEPTISFYKDIFLMFPSVIFILFYRKSHQLFNSSARLGLSIIFLITFLMFAINNTYWNEPRFDFRPFKDGVNIRSIKKAELEALAKMPISFKMIPKNGEKSVILTQDEYMKRFKEFPSEQFDVEQIKGEPNIAATKISQFLFYNKENQEVSEPFLEDTNYTLMITLYHLDFEMKDQLVEKKDTLFFQGDSTFNQTKDSILRINTTQENIKMPYFSNKLIHQFNNTVKPLLTELKNSKIKIIFLFGGVDNSIVQELKKKTNLEFENYEADDVILKTMLRSNPGFILWKDGTIIKKWHINDQLNPKIIKSYIK